MRKRANSIRPNDRFSVGILDFVTDRTKSVYLGSLSAALVPAVIMSLCTVYFLEKPADLWLDSVPANMDVLEYPSSMLIAEPCCQGNFRFLVSNNARLPINSVMINATLVRYTPDLEYFFCKNLISGTLREERLRSVCTPTVYSQQAFTDANGYGSIENLSIVAGVPGMYVFKVTAHRSVTGRNAKGVLGTVYVDAVSRNFSIRVARNPGLIIVPARVAPDTIAYGQPLDGTGPACASSNRAATQCALAARPDLSAPAATLIYTGNGSLSPGIAMAFFVVGHLEEVLLPDAQFPRTASPHTVGSRLRMARIVDASGATSLSQPVTAGGDPAVFPGVTVVGATNPALFFAFHVCGAFALWNRNWPGEGGQLQVQEVLALPPNGSKGERAGLGDFWMGGQASGLRLRRMQGSRPVHGAVIRVASALEQLRRRRYRNAFRTFGRCDRSRRHPSVFDWGG